MLKNHVKIAWRNLIRNKGFSLLNILGLSIGLTVTALIVLWMNFEMGFDKFHANDERLYQVYNKYPLDGEIWTWNSTPKIMAKTIEKEYPEVERISRYFYDTPFLFSFEEKRIKAEGTAVDPDFLHIFSFPLAKGDVNQVLEGTNSLVLTETFAKKLFGDEDPIGKAVKIDNLDLLTVTGVLKDLPENTEFNFEYLVPWEYIVQKGWDDENWGNNSVATYVMLKKGVDYNAFSSKIKTLRARYDKETPDMETYLYPFSRGYLYGEFENGKESGGRIDIISMFGLIACIVLLIACINFMNLSTARSEKRAKEVGIRKVIGAKKGSLIRQFLGESLLLSLLSALIALLLVALTLPAFSDLIDKPLSLNLTRPAFWLMGLLLVLFTGILAGSYPALFLSAFKPAAVLKGTFQKVNSLITPRKVLVVLQFAVAIILITATIIVKQQVAKAQDRQLGYAKDKLVYTVMEGDMHKNYESIKRELLSSNAIASITKTMSPITESWSNHWNMEWKGKREDDKTLIYRLSSDGALVKTLNLELTLGRDMDLKKYPTDSTAVILNEAAVAHMGFKNPLGQIIKDNGANWTVIGVVKNFVFNSPFQKIEPVIIKGAKAWGQVIHIKFNDNSSMVQNLAEVKAIFQKFNPEYPFEYRFVDQMYAKKFEDQQKTETLASLFSLLTIFISCLGLFGLASYLAANRVKEIGVRKVLGATTISITSLLSKSFLKLVFIACVIATPITWYIMNRWLATFEFRVKVSLWYFITAGLLAMAIALLTVSYQAIKAALANPVKSLRTE
ncbi:MAG: ABC transporter permease [Bacteroidota bacterium]